MTRLIVIAFVVAAALMVFAFVDAVFFDRLRVRGVPKPAWLIIILFVPIVGALLWFFVGRGPRGYRGPGNGRRRGPVAPDDNPDFLRNLNIPKPTEPGTTDPKPTDPKPEDETDKR